MKKAGLAALAACLIVGAIALASTLFAQGVAPPKKDWSRLQVVTYSSGLTGFFDPESGKLYLYDAKLEKCYAIRQLVRLGQPLRTPNR